MFERPFCLASFALSKYHDDSNTLITDTCWLLHTNHWHSLSHQGLLTLEDPFTSEFHVESSQKEREGERQRKTMSLAPGHYNDYHAWRWLKPHQDFWVPQSGRQQAGCLCLPLKLLEGPDVLDLDPRWRRAQWQGKGDETQARFTNKLQARV